MDALVVAKAHTNSPSFIRVKLYVSLSYFGHRGEDYCWGDNKSGCRGIHLHFRMCEELAWIYNVSADTCLKEVGVYTYSIECSPELNYCRLLT